MSSRETETITSISSRKQNKAGLIFPREEKLVQANQDLTWTIPETSNWTKIELIFKLKHLQSFLENNEKEIYLNWDSIKGRKKRS